MQANPIEYYNVIILNEFIHLQHSNQTQFAILIVSNDIQCKYKKKNHNVNSTPRMAYNLK